MHYSLDENYACTVLSKGAGWSRGVAGPAIQQLMISCHGSQSRRDVRGTLKGCMCPGRTPGVLSPWCRMSPGQIEIRKSYASEADSHSWLRAAKLSLGQVYISFLLLSASVSPVTI